MISINSISSTSFVDVAILTMGTNWAGEIGALWEYPLLANDGYD